MKDLNLAVNKIGQTRAILAQTSKSASVTKLIQFP